MAERRLLSIVDGEQLRRMLQIMLDEQEFLSPHGIRALSRHHHDHPFTIAFDGREHRVDYEPGESSTGLFGGNSNWRGPVWFPVELFTNRIAAEVPLLLWRQHQSRIPFAFWQHAQSFRSCCGNLAPPDGDLPRNEEGHRPVHWGVPKFRTDPNWSDLILFYEYFHGDTGQGLGASHQTGWTALVTKLLQQSRDSSTPKGLRS